MTEKAKSIIAVPAGRLTDMAFQRLLRGGVLLADAVDAFRRNGDDTKPLSTTVTGVYAQVFSPRDTVTNLLIPERRVIVAISGDDYVVDQGLLGFNPATGELVIPDDPKIERVGIIRAFGSNGAEIRPEVVLAVKRAEWEGATPEEIVASGKIRKAVVKRGTYENIAKMYIDHHSMHTELEVRGGKLEPYVREGWVDGAFDAKESGRHLQENGLYGIRVMQTHCAVFAVQGWQMSSLADQTGTILERVGKVSVPL